MELSVGRYAVKLNLQREAQGDALLLLHALGGAASDFQEHVIGWAGPVYALDFSGHGFSGRVYGGDYTPELLAVEADVALGQIGGATLLGVGLGAYVALLLAGGRPSLVPGAVLVDGHGVAGGFDRPQIQPAARFNPPRASQPARGLQQQPHTDSCATYALSTDIRPPEYALDFARRARRLWLAGAHAGQPPWWRAVGELEGVTQGGDGLAWALAQVGRLAEP